MRLLLSLIVACRTDAPAPVGDMVPIPGGTVLLGPRHQPPVPGFAPAAPGGATPGGGRGDQRRAPGAPPGAGPGGPPQPPKATRTPWEAATGARLAPRRVTVDAFEIDRHEVTRAAYQAFLRETGYRPPFVDEAWAQDGWNWDGLAYPPGTGDHPVVLVSWFDATEYCRWAGKRLPTEAEWQRAALGEGRTYPWGDVYDPSRLNHGTIDAPNFDASDGHERTAPVGSYPSGDTPEGVADLFGNAWEFTADVRRDQWSMYRDADGQPLRGDGAARGAHAPGPGLYVAVRGGSYFFDLRPNPGGERHQFLTEIRRKTSGFRCAR